MARRKKTILGLKSNIPAQRQFTDREEPQESFKKALENINEKEYSILTYYGVGGVGKSSLQKHLKSHHLDNNPNNIYSWVDFDIQANRFIHKALRVLAQNFKSKYKIKFTAFDIAYIIYWSKAFPDHDIKKDGLPFLDEGSILSDAVDTLSDAGGLINVAFRLVTYVAEKLTEHSFDKTLQQELRNLNKLEAYEIEKKLSIFFACDIDNYKKNNPTHNIVIFFDTYEALWEQNRSEAKFFVIDEWIRDFITELPHILFVICGREKIRWAEIESEWETDLNQHILGNLSKDDIKSFLNSCNLTNENIQNEIIKSSSGLPYYLDLCVDTYFQIIDSGEIPTVEEFKELEKEKIFERFMRYLSLEEQETLKILANARFYTKEIFSKLVIEFKTGYPVTAMYQLSNFSFISEDNDIFYIHDLMRKSLISFQNNELNIDVNDFLFGYYDSKIKVLEVKEITQESEEALKEAFYHKKNMLQVEDLSKWFNSYSESFFYAGKYDTILDLTLIVINELEEKIGIENSEVAINYSNLAQVYLILKDYKNALFYQEKALKIQEEVLGIENHYTAKSYINLALIFNEKGDDRALEFAEKALKIYFKIHGKEHLDIIQVLINIGTIHHKLNNYTYAMSYYSQALKISEEIIIKNSFKEKKFLFSKAAAYNNIAEIYRENYEYDFALHYYEIALKSYKEIFGAKNIHLSPIYSNIGLACKYNGNYTSSISNYKKSLEIIEYLLGKEDQRYIDEYEKLLDVYKIQDTQEEGKPIPLTC